MMKRVKNSKFLTTLKRWTEPSIRLYLVVLICFSAALPFLAVWLSTLIGFAAAGLLILYTKLYHKKLQKDVLNYICSSKSHDDGSTELILKMPLPVMIFRIKDRNVLWMNDRLQELVEDRDHSFGLGIGEVFPGFSWKWMTEDKSVSPELAVIGDRKFRVYGSVIQSGDNGTLWGMVYLVDVTDYAATAEEYTLSRPVTAIMLLDNYEELFKNVDETEKSRILAAIDGVVGEWCAAAHGYLCRYERDRYVFFFEERYLRSYEARRFSLLDTVRSQHNTEGIAPTLSIGIGRGAESVADSYRYAMQGIDMAVSRGGDQVVIKTGADYSFYGGKTSATERPSKVRARVSANTLRELIVESERVLIMGHKNADADSVGAAAGLVCAARKIGRPANIVLDPENNMAKSLITRLERNPVYQNCFIGEPLALKQDNENTLLIVVDTSRPERVESAELLEACGKIVVIDHHRRAAEYIERNVFALCEPYSSSTCETVAELLNYLVEPRDILRAEADALMSGIFLDTKNFSLRTSSRTFEAAAFLRKSGSDTTEVKKFFRSGLDETLERVGILSNAVMYRPGIIIASCPGCSDRAAAGAAADELINIEGVEASFVIYGGSGLNISARSVEKVNVQVILEELGGGGSSSNAGAQFSGRTEEEIIALLKASIDRNT